MFEWLRRALGRSPSPSPAARTSPAAVPVEQFNALNDRFRDLKAKYDAAQTNDDNQRHWRHADGLSSSAANSPWIRRTLRIRSRYEYDNGAYCSGIIRTYADDLVGTGPKLQVLTQDDTLNKAIETGFAAWGLAIGLAEKLHTMAQAKAKDGEAFALMVTNLRSRHPVKLDLKLLEADQVADPYGLAFPQEGHLDGIEYDALWNPIAFHVLKQHPGDLLIHQPIAFDRIEARFMLHWMRRDRPGQLRGVPELTAALPLFPYLRRWTLATLAAAEYAASQAGVLETDAPLEATPANSPYKIVEFDRGMFTELPGGYKLKQLTAEHPNQQYGDFKREICNEGGRPLRMPSNVVSADSSKHNFSSAKLDHFGYRGGLKVDRRFAATNLLDPLLAMYAEEAALVRYTPAGVDVAALPHAWVWPGWASMDSDQAASDAERLLNGTLTLADYWAEQGEDWQEKIRQRGREIALCIELGVPAVPEKPKVPSEPPPATDPNAPNPQPDPGNEQNQNGTAAASAHRLAVHLAQAGRNGTSGRG